VPPERINTIADFPAIERLGIRGDGTAVAASIDAVAEIAGLVADGALEIPIAATYPLAAVRDAYAELAERHTRGKIVLIP
jgi:NADPH:quinone reductase-like Zn-dependent oxidoreductase